MEKNLCEAIVRGGSLQTVDIRHGWEEWKVKLSYKLRNALHDNKSAADMATQLSQVCRLDKFAGSRETFKSALFRLWLLSQWLSPGALPQHLKSRIMRMPRV